MPYDIYMKIEGVKGETTAKDMVDYMSILSFSFGASNPTTIGAAATGAGGGRVSVSDFNIMKNTDAASAALFQACCDGTHFTTASVVLRKAGGKDAGQLPFLKYDFEEVFISSVQWSGSGGGDISPAESISISFGKISVEYSKQDDKGKMAKAGQAAWDVRTASSTA